MIETDSVGYSSLKFYCSESMKIFGKNNKKILDNHLIIDVTIHWGIQKQV